MRLHFVVIFLGLVAAAAVLPACGSSDLFTNLSADDRFELGKKAFDDEDYLAAMEHFTAVTVQFPGSGVADDAQFFLGESRFARGEYLLAAYEYETLRKSMPASPLVPLAQYKIGLCYYQLSPKPPLDQKYTAKAIDELQTFIEYYPTHELVVDAEAKIRELNNRVAKKDYDTAVLYMKLEYYKAALFYFNSVLEKYHDSEYAERAHLGKIEALIARKRFEEARVETEKFLARFPNSEYRSTIEALQNDIDKNLRGRSAADENYRATNFAQQW